ncbi:helix-turn-helix domain-containing protein [Cohnella cellulosilytica]|uniref:Helix-turn-helix domain-containing protein n=1 Tax=Cohnella cellulosilytica TaxID=986710 RepID=A0ABW2FI34_9BACL
MADLCFRYPPIPCYIAGGTDTYHPGDIHPSRYRLGVFDLLLVTRGALYIGENETSWEVRANCAVILKPDRHQYPVQGCEEQTEFYWIHFNVFGEWSEYVEGEWIEHAGEQVKLFEDPEDDRKNVKFHTIRLNQFTSLPHPEEVIRCCRDLLELETSPREEDQLRQQLILQSILLELQAAQSNRRDPYKQLIAERAATYIRKNYRMPITHSVIRKELNFHPSYISRCMKQIYGTTLNEYAIRYRIEQASRLLLTTNDSVKEIADKVGFNNLSYFARAFVRLKKLSPGAYRKQVEKREE